PTDRYSKPEAGCSKNVSQSRIQHPASSISKPASIRAFTLTELLVVLVIIGLLAAATLPSLSHMMHSNAMTAATRQMLDDLAYARQKAINDHAKVYVVFIPPQFWDGANKNAASSLGSASSSNLTELITSQYTSYALYAERSIGDQPGQSNPRYITPV